MLIIKFIFWKNKNEEIERKKQDEIDKSHEYL